MSAAIVPPAVPPRSPSPKSKALMALIDIAEPGFRLSLAGVRFAEYVALLHARTDAGRMGVKIAFDRGEVEIMAVGGTHERFKKVLAAPLETWMEECGCEFPPGGGMTHLREDLDHGFEPDECYYIQNWSKVTGARDIDLTKDPPPDLAIEIEVQHSVPNRLPIHAAFKIPEVWRYNGSRLVVLLLQPDGTYLESAVSRALPAIPIVELPGALAMANDLAIGILEMKRRFRQWIRALPVLRTHRPPDFFQRVPCLTF